MSVTFTIELTESQRLALIDLILHSLKCSCDARVEAFIDCTRTPSVTTTAGELLKLVSASEMTEKRGTR